MMLIFTLMSLCLASMIFNKVGMIFIDAEVLREGNNQVLNNLEEGVIILKEDDFQI